MMLPSTLSVNVLLPALLHVLLLVLLHALLNVFLLRPPLRTPTIAGTIATTETKFSVTVPRAPGFRETNCPAGASI